MTLSYDDGVALVKQHWAAKGTDKCYGKSAAFNALRTHLEGTITPYSHEEALRWLDANRSDWSKSKFMSARRAIFELNDIMTTGSISDEDYKYGTDPFDDLSEYWQSRCLEYIEYLKTVRSKRAICEQRKPCLRFASYLTKNQIECAENISCSVISDYHSYAETVGDTYKSIYSVRYFLQFLVGRGLLPEHRPLTLTAPIQAKAIGYALKNRRNNEIQPFSDDVEPKKFWKEAETFVSLLEKDFHYGRDALHNNFTTYFQMFYIFCSECNVKCSSEIEEKWISLMSDFWKYDQQKNSLLRAFRLFHIYQSTGKISIADLNEHNTDKGSIVKLSTYYLRILTDFLESRRKENNAEATVHANRSGTLSFLLYLQQQKIENIMGVSHETVKQYCIWVSNKSTSKYNNYASDLRAFLLFLFEKEYTIYDLSRALPVQSSQFRKIVDILSDEEIKTIYEYRNKAKTSLELRDSAILMIGLRMGLRRIDIVNLKKSDIDWKARTISITQQKTYRPLVLPMPVSVANSIYLYMKTARPDSDSDFVFLSTAAPYKKAHTSACGVAVEHALPGRKRGFHILRRTFASKLLVSGAKTETIKDTLGHSSMHTLSRYLSVDEKTLKSCCLPLARTEVTNEATT